MSKRRKTTTKRCRGECYLALQFWELESPAFATLSADATRVYLFMRKRLNFDSSNNGHVAPPHPGGGNELMSKRRKTTTKRCRGECYLALQFWELESPAFATLSADATRVYLFMRKRLNFDSSNNGHVAFSHRDAAAALNSDWRRGSNAIAN